jgi:hypothetical protein
LVGFQYFQFSPERPGKRRSYVLERISPLYKRVIVADECPII